MECVARAKGILGGANISPCMEAQWSLGYGLVWEAEGSTGQGLTLVHFSAQLEPCLTHTNTLLTLKTP
jgi:hypothetical protein